MSVLDCWGHFIEKKKKMIQALIINEGYSSLMGLLPWQLLAHRSIYNKPVNSFDTKEWLSCVFFCTHAWNLLGHNCAAFLVSARVTSIF